jgi:hypothetical protein
MAYAYIVLESMHTWEDDVEKYSKETVCVRVD